jgi:hypothetical protein
MARTTHSDLVRELRRIAKALESVPACYIAADASSRAFIASAADVIEAQDARADATTIVLRKSRTRLQETGFADDKPLIADINAALNWRT